MSVGIYCIENVLNRKVYIGKSKNIEKRFENHIKKLNTGRHYNTHLQSAWNIYGQHNFKFKILEEIIEETSLDEQEKFYVSLMNSDNSEFGYNLTKGGDGIDYSALSEETKINRNKAVSSALKGRQIKNRITTGMAGKNHSEETKRKISENKKGKSAWNKGLTAKDDERVKRNITENSKRTQFFKGHIPWNKKENEVNT